jgi:multisubunit Na+/H+ antiporter MnhB subunit
MIVGALIAIETSNLLSSIICVGAVGFLVSIAFLILGAPDIAITQVVVEILCLVILIRATINRDLTTISGDREFFGMIVTVVLVLTLVVFSIQMFEEFPTLGDPVTKRMAVANGAIPAAPSVTYVEKGLEKTGAANIVTAILLDFRAYDTMGEATVLFCAIWGALAILRKKARKHREEVDGESDAA